MSYPAKSVYYFSFYMMALSLTLLLVPNLLAPLLGYTEVNYIWIRVIGMFLLYLAFDYWVSAKEENLKFFYLTVYTRVTIILFMSFFVMMGWIKWIFIPLSLIDFSGALWTAYALYRHRRQRRTDSRLQA
ncbi:hypothetical protein O9H85_19365 [Paenibacillus filicis]|uniref:Uncharacterized protein n=1 Tax=Paenibacillus gyeongsangnamensis TaxID=3388067 RepID=A0ABT4QCC2_9BACL|nr:hypothetical protein [Paenibacillus filicis]MCZ8514542.1 hypothetical protein [Paenibacillus filicis]